MYPFLNILTFEYRFPCRADNAAYPHDGRADKRRYRHDRRADSQCHKVPAFTPFQLKSSLLWLSEFIINHTPAEHPLMATCLHAVAMGPTNQKLFT